MRFPTWGHRWICGLALAAGATGPDPLWADGSPAARRPATEGASIATDPRSAAMLRPFQQEAASPRPSPDDMARTIEKGSSSNEVRADAIAGLPLDKLTPQDRRAAKEILDLVGLFRRLPTISIECDPAVYDYFLRQPDAAVSIWRALEISDFRMTPIGPGSYRADAGDGTMGTVRMLHQSRNELLALCSGEYKSPLLPRPIESRALLHLETRFVQDRDGKTRAVHRLNMFVAFPSQTIETAAKLISPVSNMVLDRNFKEVSLFIHMMTLAMVRQPGWVEQLANRLEDIPPEARQELIDLTAETYLAEVQRVNDLKRRELEATRHGLIRPAGAQRR